MSDDTGEKQEAAFVQAKDIRIYLPPSWLTRGFVYRVLICFFVLGLIPTVLLITGGDQFIRNTIDDWMSGPDLYESLALEPHEYRHLPVRWRQALAEIAVKEEPGGAAIQELINKLKPAHIMLVDQIAPFEAGGFIVRDVSEISQHPIPRLSLVDFATLEELGILHGVQQGLTMTIRLDSSSSYQSHLLGASVALVMRAAQKDSEVKFAITRFTETGLNLIRLLRVPSDIRYFEWLAKRIEQPDVGVELWAIERRGLDPDAEIVGLGRIQRDTVPSWPSES